MRPGLLEKYRVEDAVPLTVDRERVGEKFSLEGLRQMKDTAISKKDMLCQP